MVWTNFLICGLEISWIKFSEIFCTLQHVHFVKCTLCNTCTLQHVLFATCAVFDTYNLQHLQFLKHRILSKLQFSTRVIYNTCSEGRYRVSHNKVYLLNIPISQPPNIAQRLFSTRNLCLDITFQKNYVFMF